MEVIKAPHAYTQCPRPWVFLGGVIDMGTARTWQTDIAEALQAERGTLLNPRRDDWDSSWVQAASNPQFREQVEWELLAQEVANWSTIVLDADSKAPISLLELGLHARAEHIINRPGYIQQLRVHEGGHEKLPGVGNQRV